MNIFDKFAALAKDKSANIGIGLGEDKNHNRKILNATSNFLNGHKAKISFFGTRSQIDDLLSEPRYKKSESMINLVYSGEPEELILDFLLSGRLDAVIRGSLSSSKFLNCLKKNLKLSEINRLTLLETSSGFQFFYGPVGIDECNDYEKKITFLNKAIKILNFLTITPKISILSGGRTSDIGRDQHVDETIKTAEKVVNHFQKEHPNLEISHDEILIETAIEHKKNLIIAPDGISGNLIYRTLVHLGSGNAYGAIYMDVNHVIIDTSRVGKQAEIEGAFKLALSLIP